MFESTESESCAAETGPRKIMRRRRKNVKNAEHTDAIFLLVFWFMLFFNIIDLIKLLDSVLSFF